MGKRNPNTDPLQPPVFVKGGTIYRPQQTGGVVGNAGDDNPVPVMSNMPLGSSMNARQDKKDK